MSKLHTDWLKQLKDRIQDGRWLERNHPDGRAARLDTVLVGLDYHIGLLYKMTEKGGQYFQIFLNPDGTEVEDAFWSSEESSEPELYTREEGFAVEQHIKKNFGEFDKVFHELFPGYPCRPLYSSTYRRAKLLHAGYHGNGSSPDECAGGTG